MTCPFCDDFKPVLKNELAYVRYDKYPVTNGHILIIPYRHVSNFFELSSEERAAVFLLADEAKIMLDRKYMPDGYNIGINVGVVAGQTVWHVHVHLIPRYKGDVVNPSGGIRGVIPNKADYLNE